MENEEGLDSPAAIRAGLASLGYLADLGLSTVVYLALSMGRPLFLEGEPGSGKTELAKALATLTGGSLLRLQCYEGIDISQAVYEWDYTRQLMHLRASEATAGRRAEELEDELFSERFLIRRPLLAALDTKPGGPRPVLLIDEVDRADDEFEAFLLEALSDYAVTVPEIGTISATVRPIVVLTSNRTRDVHDALKRRSLYHWLEHPDFDREVAIVAGRVPGIAIELARQVTSVVETLRALHLYKPPGVAETIDWARALSSLGAAALDAETIEATLGLVVKYREDVEAVKALDLVGLLGHTTSGG
jgi:MoxR-like ATPase